MSSMTDIEKCCACGHQELPGEVCCSAWGAGSFYYCVCCLMMGADDKVLCEWMSDGDPQIVYMTFDREKDVYVDNTGKEYPIVFTDGVSVRTYTEAAPLILARISL